MNYVEQAVLFSVGSEQLLGIVATPDTPIDWGVLIVVGGPQYRVGSHRQFLLLTRRLAAEGYPTMRFDYRGMGDSDGAMRNFEEVADDIGAAIDTFQRSCPSIRRVVLWGLCDAASSALLYVQATRDSRIAGLVLLNPWVRSEASLAQTHIKHYYGQRLLQREFWFKLLSGKLSLMQSVRGLVSSALKARGTSDNVESKSRSFQDRMAEGLRQFSGRVLLILSGEDFTAKEFLEYAGVNAAWSGLLDTDRISRVELPDADHTFSAQALRSHVEDATLDWLASLER
ncbi:MAG: hydrolase 1, exosortase A system-associated [Propionivibrio sp.]|uniref:hydrolase 1, exosortase A system-associated n=1 Tax=Propionivibrio sp. TaxID=2212460 RepID=UPI0025D79D00|nr:hydrolase 1, exosortase A system-associated [Propionivibrio sp.]MBL0209220.1 hydrolase 1, exosortase A system-associated [Propionivibrio sp.]